MVRKAGLGNVRLIGHVKIKKTRHLSRGTESAVGSMSLAFQCTNTIYKV